MKLLVDRQRVRENPGMHNADGRDIGERLLDVQIVGGERVRSRGEQVEDTDPVGAQSHRQRAHPGESP
ncbi:hypothetical protein BJY24_005604 [Nocardia transvalensis]|uniref:Uncharacterized protein n=1 Tax=Nocardia transvalensis TaxID=37333 RepID=A0A7W9PII0_9NOCA|nr:hypothetical protein [Nocardia transvalensis]MBB5916692.1 hypothetical protein [Nocardia transvalensis]